MPETITIRTSAADDVAAVDALLRRSYPVLLKADYPPSVMVTAVPLISRAQPALVTCGTYYIAEDSSGRCLGAGGWTPKRRQPNAADIRHVATDPRATRRGVGRALMARIVDDARAAGISRLDCLATRTAVPFYQAMGFITLGPLELPLAKAIRFPAIQMQRRI